MCALVTGFQTCALPISEVPVIRRNDEVGDLTRAFSRMGDSIVRHDRDIRRMAYTDALTGLSNRLAFREHLDQQMMLVRGAAWQLALLFADIHDFQRLKETLGQDTGAVVIVHETRSGRHLEKEDK